MSVSTLNKTLRALLAAVVVFGCVQMPGRVSAEVRIKDIANYVGIRENQLTGYGLIMGLEGTGDKNRTIFTMQSMSNMLKRYGLNIDPKEMKVKNVAAVLVMANLGPFVRQGDRIDVTVASIGDASNLQGGYLLMTPLKGADDKVYAVAQGPVSIGGFNFSSGGGAEGEGAATARKNFTTVGRVPDGAIVEQAVPMQLVDKGKITYSLKNPDYTTASRVAKVVNAKYPGSTRALDAGTIEVRVPSYYVESNSITPFVESIESLRINPDMKAKIVINERTGTIVAGGNVRISTVAVSHGNLQLTIKNTPSVSQPNAFGGGQSVVTSQAGVDVTEEQSRLVVLEEGVSINEVSDALNSLGVTPRDMISIFQTMKEAGALQAELVTI